MKNKLSIGIMIIGGILTLLAIKRIQEAITIILTSLGFLGMIIGITTMKLENEEERNGHTKTRTIPKRDM